MNKLICILLHWLSSFSLRQDILLAHCKNCNHSIFPNAMIDFKIPYRWCIAPLCRIWFFSNLKPLFSKVKKVVSFFTFVLVPIFGSSRSHCFAAEWPNSFSKMRIQCKSSLIWSLSHQIRAPYQFHLLEILANRLIAVRAKLNCHRYFECT